MGGSIISPERLAAWALRLVLAASLLAGAAAQAKQFRGVVSHVSDGDSLWVRPADGGAPVEIRLLDLDAPEGCQAFGPQAKEALARRVLRQSAIVRPRGTDDYGRTLARVRHRGEDLGAWLVRDGYAWSSGSRKRPGPYAALEDAARQGRKGLWAEPGAQNPRMFRRTHGRCQRG